VVPRASSSADVSDSRFAGSSDESDTKLCIDESKPEYSIFNAFPFAIIISSLRFSFAYSLTFLKARALCRKVSKLPVITKEFN